MLGLEQTISDAICLINRLVVGDYCCCFWAADIQRGSKQDFLMLLSVNGSQLLHLWLALQHQSLSLGQQRVPQSRVSCLYWGNHLYFILCSQSVLCLYTAWG